MRLVCLFLLAGCGVGTGVDDVSSTVKIIANAEPALGSDLVAHAAVQTGFGYHLILVTDKAGLTGIQCPGKAQHKKGHASWKCIASLGGGGLVVQPDAKRVIISSKVSSINTATDDCELDLDEDVDTL
jgi:hypothetical protein